MTTPEDLRVFKLIAEHLKRHDKAISWIRSILWFIIGIIVYQIFFYKN
jgi:hypothetical protein